MLSRRVRGSIDHEEEAKHEERRVTETMKSGLKQMMGDKDMRRQRLKTVKLKSEIDNLMDEFD
jgi:hypothetical protein